MLSTALDWQMLPKAATEIQQWSKARVTLEQTHSLILFSLWSYVTEFVLFYYLW